jgi:chemotaxis protein histidine kinase CheA
METEEVTVPSTEAEPADEAPTPTPADAEETSFDEPASDVEETLAADQEPEPAEEGQPPQEPETLEESAAAAESPEAPEEHPAPELVLEKEPEPAAAAAGLTLDDMVAEIKESQGTEEPAPGETQDAEGTEAAQGEVAETAESEAAEGEGVEGATETVAEEGAEGAVEGAPADAAEAVATAEEAANETGPARDRMDTCVPFWVYGGVWVVFAGVMTYLLWPVSAGLFTGSSRYAIFVLGGAGLTVIGVFVGLAAWLTGRSGTSQEEKQGLTQAILLRTAGWMTVGVALWWIALIALDLHRTGVIR